ncbi:MAG: hypothetical protein GXC72_12620 [Chitinophagaceae bacterium]|jgi:hypothetical protein|nr:hypothetical protein [Chitinophagaceae bacterium]
MKTISLELEDMIFEDTVKITASLQVDRNRYMNDAVRLYNSYQKRQLLKRKLQRDSLLGQAESMAILEEFEKLTDDHLAI